MIDICIVCAHDAHKTASALKRLLTAEGWSAQVVYGRASLAQLDETCARREAIVLIWSVDAPSTDYMNRWLAAADPIKLVEIARAPLWPSRPGRRAPVIDFSKWGEADRGGKAWAALDDRLRQVARATEPKRPQPLKPALALATAGLAAAAGAVWVRGTMVEPSAPMAMEDGVSVAAVFDPLQPDEEYGPSGGPLDFSEPASILDGDAAIVLGAPAPRVALIEAAPAPGALTPTRVAPAMEYREANLIERALDRF